MNNLVRIEPPVCPVSESHPVGRIEPCYQRESHPVIISAKLEDCAVISKAQIFIAGKSLNDRLLGNPATRFVIITAGLNVLSQEIYPVLLL
jgi:hypothetical protein